MPIRFSITLTAAKSGCFNIVKTDELILTNEKHILYDAQIIQSGLLSIFSATIIMPKTIPIMYKAKL